MGLLPNLFSDPALRARQDQLDAIWNSLRASYNQCNGTPDNAFAQFSTDYQGWKDFYDSGSDWSASSKHATDQWQTTAASWSDKLNQWCSGESAGIPGVEPNPPDPPPSGFLNELKADVAAPFTWAEGLVLKIGIGIGVILLIAIVAIIYITIKGHASVSASGVQVGK